MDRGCRGRRAADARAAPLHFDVLGQYRDVINAEAVRGFAFRLQVIRNPVFCHDARGFLGERSAQILGTAKISWA